MKVITLTQPWATLVAIGAKRIETRSWATKYRGPLLIHAAAGLGPGGKRAFYARCYSTVFGNALAPAIKGTREIAGYTIPHFDAGKLPRGAIIARANLIRIVETDDLLVDGRASVITGQGIETWHLSDQEVSFGDYTPGRYAWLLADVQPLATPIPAKGKLGLWEFDLPNHRTNQATPLPNAVG